MRKQIYKKILFLLFGLALAGLFVAHASRANATSPNLINFQGKVVNADGTNVANGAYNFDFILWDDPTAGTNRWQELTKSITVTNGVFQTNLGSATALPNFNTYPNLYLAVRFNGDAAGYMSPRVQLTSVPYALNADNLGGLASASYAQLGISTQTFTGANIFTPGSTNDLTFNGDDDSNFQINSTIGADVTQTGLAFTLTDNAAASTGTLYGLSLTNADNGANVGVPDAIAAIISLNANETVPTGLLIENNGGVLSTLTNGIEIRPSSGRITNGITFTGFVSSDKLINSTGLSVTAAGAGVFASTLTVNGTSLSLGNGSAATISTPSGAAAITIAPNTTGVLNLATTNTGAVAIGNATGTFALTSAGGLNVTTGGALTGVASIDTIATSATALTFAGAGTIKSTGANALTLDSGTTGIVNLGTGTSGKTINIGTDNTTADTIVIGSALDTLQIKSLSTIAANGVLYLSDTAGKVAETAASTGAQCLQTAGAGTAPIWGACGGGGATLQSAYDASSGNTILTTTARNIAFTLGEVATPTSFTIENQDTAGTSAERIFNSIAGATTLTNGLLIEQTGTGTMTNAIQILETAGAITTGLNIGANLTTGISLGAGLTTGILVGSGGVTITSGALAVNSDSITSDGVLVINSATSTDIQDALNADSLTTDTGGVSIASGQAYTGAGAVSLDSASGTALTIGTGANAHNVTVGNTTTTSTLTLQAGSGDINLLTSTGNNVQVGSSTTDANITLLILDSYNTTDPTGTNGAMYYSTSTNKFRCFEASAWKDCDTTGSGSSPFTRVAGSSGAAGADVTLQRLTSNSADVTTTALSSSIMSTTGVGAGTWKFRYSIVYQTAATTTGISFGVNHTGASSTLNQAMWYMITTGTTASTGIGDNVASTNAGQLAEGKSGTTLNAIIGSASAGVAAINTNTMAVLEGTLVVTNSGTLELKIGSEVASSAVRVMANSLLELTKY